MARMHTIRVATGFTLSGALLAQIAGCGSGETSAPSTADATSSVPATNDSVPVSPASSSKSSPVTASIDGPKTASLDGARAAEAGSKTASAFPDDDATRSLREIQQLRTAPVPTDLEQARTARRERNEKIVTLATNALKITVDDESRKPQFHQAIGQLMEARFQMALAGTEDDVNQFYADVQALNERDPKSIAAAEGVYYIARFAHTKAGLVGRKEPVWFESLSRWAREFAERFPSQQQRAVSLLFGAARSCEVQASASNDAPMAKRLMTESKLCYTALAEKFPKSDQGQEATASLRRLELEGQVLSQFSGPTADGGRVSSDEFPGKPTLIYFWESEEESFQEDMLPLLQKIRAQVPNDRLRMVGVALDEDETIMNTFMESHQVPGQQIYFPNVEQRSWNSPLIRFWGIAECPSIWLVDANGKVVSTSCRLDDLTKQLQLLLK